MEVVGVYGRASIDKKELRISTTRQVDRGSELAKATWPGCEIIVYQDNNLSASDPDVDRPDFRRLLADIRQGKLTQIVAHEQSRITRIPSVWEEFVIATSRAGIDTLHTVLKGSVSLAPGNRLVGRIMAVIDANESEVIKLRATAMHEHLASTGRPNGGRYYGYRRQLGPDGRPALLIYEPEAAIVRRIVDMLLAGRSAYQVAETFNDQGIPTGRGGKRWWGQAVLAIARAPHVAGLRKHRGQVVGEGTWKPIIDRDRWELLLATINTDPHRGRAWKSRRWLLTGGIALCGVCRAPMITNKQPRPGGNIDAFICSPRSHRAPDACGKVSLSPAELVEEIVIGAALEALETPEVIAALCEDDTGERAAIGERLAAAKHRVARAAELYGAGEIDEVTWRRMHAPAAAAAAEAQAQMDALLSPSVDLPPWDQIRAEWDDLTVTQKRQAIQAVIREVGILPRTGRRPADHRERIKERLRIEFRF